MKTKRRKKIFSKRHNGRKQFGGANYPDEKPAPQGQNKNNGGGNHSAESDIFWTGKTASGVFGEPVPASGGGRKTRRKRGRGRIAEKKLAGTITVEEAKKLQPNYRESLREIYEACVQEAKDAWHSVSGNVDDYCDELLRPISNFLARKTRKALGMKQKGQGRRTRVKRRKQVGGGKRGLLGGAAVASGSSPGPWAGQFVFGAEGASAGAGAGVGNDAAAANAPTESSTESPTSEDVIPSTSPSDYPPLPKQEEKIPPPSKSAPAPPGKREDIMPHRWHPDKGFQALTRSDFPEWHVEAKEIARKYPSARKALYKARFDDFGWKDPHKTMALKSIANKQELGKKNIAVAPKKLARKYKLAPPAWSGDEPASPKQPLGQMGGRRRRTRRKRRKRRKSRRRGGQNSLRMIPLKRHDYRHKIKKSSSIGLTPQATGTDFLVSDLSRGQSIASAMEREQAERRQPKEVEIVGKARKLLGINNTARPISPWMSVGCDAIMEEWEKKNKFKRHLNRNLAEKVNKCKKIKKATKAAKKKMFGTVKKGGQLTPMDVEKFNTRRIQGLQKRSASAPPAFSPTARIARKKIEAKRRRARSRDFISKQNPIWAQHTKRGRAMEMEASRSMPRSRKRRSPMRLGRGGRKTKKKR